MFYNLRLSGTFSRDVAEIDLRLNLRKCKVTCQSALPESTLICHVTRLHGSSGGKPWNSENHWAVSIMSQKRKGRDMRITSEKTIWRRATRTSEEVSRDATSCECNEAHYALFSLLTVDYRVKHTTNNWRKSLEA